MTCQEFANLIPAFLDGELAEDEARLCQDHLALCPECRARAKTLKKSVLLFTAVGKAATAPELSPNFAQDTARRVMMEGKARRPRLVRVALALAAVLLLFITGYFVRPYLPGPEKSAPATALTQSGIRFQGKGTGVEIQDDRFVLHAGDKEGRKGIDLKL